MAHPLRHAPRAPIEPTGDPRHLATRAGPRRVRLRFAPTAQAWPGRRLSGGDEENGRGVPGSRPAAGGEIPGERPRRLRVLIVEDEAVISMELEDMLEGLGCEIVGVAHTAAEAIRLAEQERPDLVTMDVSLPGNDDGVTAATAIFQRHGVRSVFVTAYTDPDTMARAAPAHPAGWLRKPINIRGLAAALDALPDPDEG